MMFHVNFRVTVQYDTILAFYNARS